MNVLGRRCRQFANGFAHIAPLRRPHYKVTVRSIAESIERERNTARRIAASQGKKKKAKQH